MPYFQSFRLEYKKLIRINLSLPNRFIILLKKITPIKKLGVER